MWFTGQESWCFVKLFHATYSRLSIFFTSKTLRQQQQLFHTEITRVLAKKDSNLKTTRSSRSLGQVHFEDSKPHNRCWWPFLESINTCSLYVIRVIIAGEYTEQKMNVTITSQHNKLCCTLGGWNKFDEYRRTLVIAACFQPSCMLTTGL